MSGKVTNADGRNGSFTNLCLKFEAFTFVTLNLRVHIYFLFQHIVV